MSGSYVITVEFQLAPGTTGAFVKAVTENARRSLAGEPGCRRFDVLLPQAGPGRVLLYEIYDDEAAFAAHCASPHLAAFELATAGMVTSKRVERFSVTGHVSVDDVG